MKRKEETAYALAAWTTVVRVARVKWLLVRVFSQGSSENSKWFRVELIARVRASS